MSRIDLCGPKDFFRKEVTSAAKNLDLNINEQTEFYLVTLLCNFITPQKIETKSGEQLEPLETPLALLLKEALESSHDVQLKIFKKLGDTSLYVAGYFQDYFNKKTYDVDYYMSMGSTAYKKMSNIMRHKNGEDHFTEMYWELSNRFEDLVEIVSVISENGLHRKDSDVLATYERWNVTQSKRLLKILLEEGITPVKSNCKKTQ